jgi:hypothetical protein
MYLSYNDVFHHRPAFRELAELVDAVRETHRAPLFFGTRRRKGFRVLV